MTDKISIDSKTAAFHFDLGMKYLIETDDIKHSGLARHHFEEASKLGHITAQYNLALLHELGEAGPRDILKAMTYYSAIIAQTPFKNEDDRRAGAQAHYNLARIHHLAIGVPRNIKMAQALYEVAARAGIPHAQNNLALILEEAGQTKRAMQLFQRAVERDYPEALLNLGLRMLDSDKISNSSRNQALEYLERARRHKSGMASHCLGHLFLRGIHDAADKKKGLAYLEEAAEWGHLMAIQDLVALYQDGILVDRNFERAEFWRSRLPAEMPPGMASDFQPGISGSSATHSILSHEQLPNSAPHFNPTQAIDWAEFMER
ncbi:MAG TPA: tetratricopeptide repeat protein [Chroococcales cyanobacterium]